MKNIRITLLALLVVCATGCQILGMPAADTFNKKWAEAEQSDTAALASALSLAQAGKISVADLKKVEEQTDNAKAGLDLARSMHASNPTAANDRLDELITTLAAITKALQEKQGGSQ